MARPITCRLGNPKADLARETPPRCAASFDWKSTQRQYRRIKLCIHLGDNSTEADILAHGVNASRVGLSKVIDGLKPGDVFVDAGTNCGIFTTFAANRVGARGHVVAIEPIPEMVRRLRLNIATNGFGNVSIFESAGRRTWYFPPLHLIRATMANPPWL